MELPAYRPALLLSHTVRTELKWLDRQCRLVVTNDAVVVIDTLGTPKLGKRLIATIKTVSDKPIRYLIVTHNHPDHAYGTVAFKRLGGVTIVSH
jgi:glyoxylase-like metal-dependent hydrolase (beta-lactamase superfamily II)